MEGVQISPTMPVPGPDTPTNPVGLPTGPLVVCDAGATAAVPGAAVAVTRLLHDDHFAPKSAGFHSHRPPITTNRYSVPGSSPVMVELPTVATGSMAAALRSVTSLGMYAMKWYCAPRLGVQLRSTAPAVAPDLAVRPAGSLTPLGGNWANTASGSGRVAKPCPQVLSGPAGPRSSALSIRYRASWSGLRSGDRCLTSAARPATWGAAWLVPPNQHRPDAG